MTFIVLCLFLRRPAMGDGCVKDLTAKYAPHWLQRTRKERVDSTWWSPALRPFLSRDFFTEMQENEEIKGIASRLVFNFDLRKFCTVYDAMFIMCCLWCCVDYVLCFVSLLCVVCVLYVMCC